VTAPLEILADWVGDSRLGDLSPASFAFLDTETTGLSGGTGTFAFLIGVGRFENQEFHLAQFFLRDPAEEPAQLAALEAFLAPCQAIVTFNGKAFDLPLLITRYNLHGWQHPFTDLIHVDLLHLARRLWKERLPSRSLGSLEVQILDAHRTEEDVPGWLIPSLFFNYLRDGDPEPLKSVFYHNAMDVLSLAALLNYSAALLANPLGEGVQHGLDLIALARFFEHLGNLDAAARLYAQALDHADAHSDRLPRDVILQAIHRLAVIHKRQDNLVAAVPLWQQAARRQHLAAHVELAKVYEHRWHDLPAAFYWTNAAIELIQTSPNEGGVSLPAYERRQWLAELEHRLTRLRRKLGEAL
jgi:hypothetical protein